jgi:hypothetical protein
LKRAYAKRGVRHKPKPSERRAARPDAGREVQLPLDRGELLGLIQGSREGLAVELGLPVASALLEDEVTRLCGARYERRPERTFTHRWQNSATVRLPSSLRRIWRRHHARRAWRLAGGPNPTMIVLPEMRHGAPGSTIPGAPSMVRPSANGSREATAFTNGELMQ